MQHRARGGWYRLLLAVLIGLLGVFLAVAGAWLVALGGSPYYVVAGVLLVASAAVIGRGERRGAWLFTAVWIGTAVWAVWEAGLDPLRLLPRLLAMTVLLVLVWLPEAIPAWRTERGRRRTGIAVAATAAAVMLAAIVLQTPDTLAQDRAPSSPTAAAAASSVDGDWNAYGGTLEGRRYSSLAQITPANVGRLSVAWTQRTGDLPDAAEAVEHRREYHSEATPIHVDGKLFTCTPHSIVQAIDATTGRTLWSWDVGASREGQSYLVCRGVAYFEAPAGTPCPRRIFAPTFDARLVALDADSGQPCAGFGNAGFVDLRENMGASPAAMQISTSPPIVANGRLVIGERIRDNVAVDSPSGVVRAYDPVSGRAIWAWDMGRDENAIAPLTGDAVYTRGTPNVWGAMTADPANGIVYLPMGNATPDYWIGNRRPFDDRFGTSIVALDLATGRLRWHRQLLHLDRWDMDLAIGPSLFDLRAADGSAVPALVQTTKMGQVFLLNRLDGSPLAAIEERPVETAGGLPGDRYSPTQPVSTGMPSFTPPPIEEKDTWGATPIDHLVCRIQRRQAHAARPFPPLNEGWAIGHPAFDGVTDWGGGTVDPVRGLFTVNTMEMPFRIRLVRRDSDEGREQLAKRSRGGENARAAQPYPQEGTPWIAVVQAWIGPFGAPCSAPPWGHLTAVDLATRQVAWREVLGTARDTGLFGTRVGLPIRTGVPNLGGPIATAGGVVFIAATTDQYLRAFDAQNGRLLWQARLPAGAQATPMTYQGRDGRQYVVVTAGGHGALGTRYGDYTIAFALPAGG